MNLSSAHQPLLPKNVRKTGGRRHGRRIMVEGERREEEGLELQHRIVEK